MADKSCRTCKYAHPVAGRGDVLRCTAEPRLERHEKKIVKIQESCHYYNANEQ